MVFNFVLVFLLGVVSALLVSSRCTAGTLRIDLHNPEKEVYKLEINRLDTLSKKKYLLLKVDPNADLSQR